MVLDHYPASTQDHRFFLSKLTFSSKYWIRIEMKNYSNYPNGNPKLNGILLMSAPLGIEPDAL